VNDVLAGVRVLDLTSALAGPSATKILADLGAEVIKIENPVGGDYTRTLMPYIFESHNRNKRSVAVDLKQPEGVDLVKRIAATCDVLVESMRPGAARDAGLGPDDLAAINPRLIYASFSAFGSSGPNAHRRGVDGVAQAESGLGALQNGILGNTSFVDTTAGLALSQAILIAVMKRERFGVVEPVEVSLLDTAVYMQAAPIAEFSVDGVLVDQQAFPARHPAAGIYRAADGPMYVTPYWDRDWRAVCEVLAREDLLSDTRFADRPSRSRNVIELKEILQKELSRRSRSEWLPALEARGVLAGALRSYPEVLAEPQLAVNKTLERHVLTDGRTAVFVRAPFRFAGEPLTTDEAAPQLGAATDEVLDELGVESAERRALYDAGVVVGGAGRNTNHVG
jgi:crotonobetainyl-CoA:carnitine CoA-transferase CaiB-like acyl-CoA transferase